MRYGLLVLMICGATCVGSCYPAIASPEGIDFIHPADFPAPESKLAELMKKLAEAFLNKDYAALVALAALISPICPVCAMKILEDIIAVHAPLTVIETVREVMQAPPSAKGWPAAPPPAPAPSSMPGILPGLAPLK